MEKLTLTAGELLEIDVLVKNSKKELEEFIKREDICSDSLKELYVKRLNIFDEIIKKIDEII